MRAPVDRQYLSALRPSSDRAAEHRLSLLLGRGRSRRRGVGRRADRGRRRRHRLRPGQSPYRTPKPGWPKAGPDCVLLDLNLPDANGIDALDRLGKLDATIPIIVLTGLNDEHFGVSAVASGAQDYLVKGRVDPEMLRRAVLYCHRAQARRAHRRRPARQPPTRPRERPNGTRAAALAAAAGEPGSRHRLPVTAEPAGRPGRRGLLRRRPDA